MGKPIRKANPKRLRISYSEKFKLEAGSLLGLAEKQAMVSAEGGGVSEKYSEEEGSFAKYWANNIWSDVLR